MDSKKEEARNRSSKNRTQVLLKLLRARETGIFIAMLFITFIMSLTSEYFLSVLNLMNVLRSMSTIAIMAIGMTMVIVTAGIDLSVGSLLAVSGMFTARLMYHGVQPLIALLLGFALGFFLGLVNGVMITKFKIAPFIATLGMLSIARGLTYLLSTGVKGTISSNIPMTNKAVNYIGAGYIGLVPFPVILMIILVTIFSLFLKYTVLGRQIYAVGSNEDAAYLSGININMVKIFVYTMTGGLCALAGIITSGLLYTAATNYGDGDEMSVIAAAVIGGASFKGGEGTVLGAAIGAAIMALLRNAFVLLHFPIYMQTISIGIVILLAVGIDQLRKHAG